MGPCVPATSMNWIQYIPVYPQQAKQEDTLKRTVNRGFAVTNIGFRATLAAYPLDDIWTTAAHHRSVFVCCQGQPSHWGAAISRQHANQANQYLDGKGVVAHMDETPHKQPFAQAHTHTHTTHI